jgi:hypothetical protein
LGPRRDLRRGGFPRICRPQHQVPELPDGLWYAAKRRLLGPPLVTEQLTSERLSKPLALGVLSCDGDRHPAMINPACELLR